MRTVHALVLILYKCGGCCIYFGLQVDLFEPKCADSRTGQFSVDVLCTSAKWGFLNIEGIRTVEGERHEAKMSRCMKTHIAHKNGKTKEEDARDNAGASLHKHARQ